MIRPPDLGLPYSDWRRSQWEVTTRAAELLAGPDIDCVIIEAPPGTGKTGIGIGVTRLLGAESVYLTSTKDLQSQYEVVSRAPRVIGRQNFGCIIAPVTADKAQCTVGYPCEYAGPTGKPSCPYYDQLRAGLAAPEVILNYAAFLHHANYAKNFLGRDLLICDEAHMLRHELESFVEFSLSFSTLRGLGLWGRGVQNSTEDEWRAWALTARKDVTRILKESQPDEDTLEVDEAGLDRQRRLQSTARTLDALLAPAARGNLVIIQDSKGVTFKPIWVAPYSQKLLFDHAQKFLLMTATPGDYSLFCQLLGISEDRAVLLRCPSIFKKERRPIYYRPVGRVSGRDSQAGAKLVPAVDSILDTYAQVKGICHTVSYKLATDIRSLSRHSRRMVIHQTATREATLQAFRLSNDPLVLLSPSVTTGVDLPYDLCRVAIQAKLPFPDTRDPVVAAQAKDPKGKKLALFDTAVTLAQSYGRGMRAEDDQCSTFLLDQNYGDWFARAASRFLPRWYKEAIVY